MATFPHGLVILYNRYIAIFFRCRCNPLAIRYGKIIKIRYAVEGCFYFSFIVKQMNVIFTLYCF